MERRFNLIIECKGNKSAVWLMLCGVSLVSPSPAVLAITSVVPRPPVRLLPVEFQPSLLGIRGIASVFYINSPTRSCDSLFHPTYTCPSTIS